ncbi:hypothetical protein RP20_CCG007475 [Aedes albopictus]|nr:hypothetical protein RP20_CCG007475 [Aedes albopictus]
MRNSDDERTPLIAAIPAPAPSVSSGSRPYGATLHPDNDEPYEGRTSLVGNHLAGESGEDMPQFVILLTVSAGALAAGIFLGWTSPTEVPLVRKKAYGFAVSTEDFSWIASMANMGASMMCILIQFLMKIIGRKRALLAMILPHLVGWCLIIFAENVSMMLIGRFFLGAGGGPFCIVAPAYTAEIAQSWNRGKLGMLYQLMVTIGILIVYKVSAAVDVQLLSIICGAAPFVFLLIFFMPTGIRYFIEPNRVSNVKDGMEELRDEYICEKLITFFQSFKQRATIRALIICLGLMFFQQLSGINAVIFYTSTIFDDANIAAEATADTTIVGAIQVVTMVFTTFIVDKVGRRILLMISDLFMAISTFVLAVYFMLKKNDVTVVENHSWIPVLAVCFFIGAYSIGYGPIPLLMVGELTASNVKTYVSPLAGGFNWLLAFLITKFFDNLMDALGIAGVFWLFSGLSLLGTVFVFFVVPETKGTTLAEIQLMLSGEEMRRYIAQDNPAMEDDEDTSILVY